MKALQVLLGVDQLLNALAGGMADETLSARAYRCEMQLNAKWSRTRKVIDAIFFWQPRHCYNAWLSEVHRTQFPREYRTD